MSRYELYAGRLINGRYPALPTKEPAGPNVTFPGADRTLDALSQIEIWLASSAEYPNAGRPVIVNVVDGQFVGDEDAGDPEEPTVVRYGGGKIDGVGDILLRRVSDTSFKIWVHQSQVDPAMVRRVTGIDIFDGHLRVLLPDQKPTRRDWLDQAAKWTGEDLVPIEREFANDHGTIIRFATLGSDPADITTFGIENITTTAVLATMRNGGGAGSGVSADNNETTYAFDWAAGNDFIASDLVHTGAGSIADPRRFWRCIRAHTSVAGNSPLLAGGGAYWLEYTRHQLPNRQNWIGFFDRSSDVSAPVDNRWGIATYGGYIAAEEYDAATQGWYVYDLADNATLFAREFAQNSETYGGIRQYNSGTPEYFVIGEKLKLLTWYQPPGHGTEIFHARPVYPFVQLELVATYDSAIAPPVANDLFDSEIEIPIDGALYVLEVDAAGNTAVLPFYQGLLSGLTAGAPVDVAGAGILTGTDADFAGDDRNARRFSIAANRTFLLGMSTGDEPTMLWGVSNVDLGRLTMRLLRVVA